MLSLKLILIYFVPYLMQEWLLYISQRYSTMFCSFLGPNNIIKIKALACTIFMFSLNTCWKLGSKSQYCYTGQNLNVIMYNNFDWFAKPWYSTLFLCMTFFVVEKSRKFNRNVSSKVFITVHTIKFKLWQFITL